MIYNTVGMAFQRALFFIYLFSIGNYSLSAQASKVKILPKLTKGDVYNIKFSFTKNQSEISQEYDFESGQNFQIERDYEDVPFEAIEDVAEAVKPVEYLLKVIDENKEFYTCNISIKFMDLSYVIGDLYKQIPMQSINKWELDMLLSSYNDSAYLDFIIYKNNSKIEILNFNQTKQRLTNSNLNFVNKFREIVFQPLMDSYKAIYTNYNNYLANNAQNKRFEILFDGFEEEHFINSESEPDFAKIMEFSLINMFTVWEYSLTSDLNNERDLINSRYTVLDMIFGLSNYEITMGDFFTLNIPVGNKRHFHNVGVHTLKSSKSNDTISLSGNWFLSDEQKVEMKKNLVPYFENFFNDIYGRMGLEDKIIIDDEILKKEVEGKGEIKIKYNTKSFMPFYYSKTITTNNLFEETSFTFEISIEKE